MEGSRKSKAMANIQKTNEEFNNHYIIDTEKMQKEEIIDTLGV